MEWFLYCKLDVLVHVIKNKVAASISEPIIVSFVSSSLAVSLLMTLYIWFGIVLSYDMVNLVSVIGTHKENCVGLPTIIF